MIPILAPVLSGNELKYVTDCIESGWISSKGEYVTTFEKKLSEIVNNEFVVAVSNGTVALSLSLSCLGIGPGDEVIVPDFTFAATINAVLHVGAIPVLADVSLKSWNIDLENLSKLITNKTKAIMPVHLYGMPVDMDKLMAFAELHKLIVVEDCAEALGAHWNDKHVGNFGAAGTFSFFGNKLVTTGEGGAIIFKTKEDYERARILRDHGMSPTKRYWHDVVGFNYRLTNLQAAVGVAQLENFDKIISLKSRVYKYYDAALESMDSIVMRETLPLSHSGYWLYTLRLSDEVAIRRESLITRLHEKGIETRRGFYPLHEMDPYQNYKRTTCNNSAMLSRSILSLPSGGNLTDKELSFITKSLKEVMED